MTNMSNSLVRRHPNQISLLSAISEVAVLSAVFVSAVFEANRLRDPESAVVAEDANTTQ